MEFKENLLNDILEINPKISLKKGVVAKKIAMEHLHENFKHIQGFELTEFKSGSKFKNQDTLVARITPCLENGKTAYVNLLEENEIAFGSTEFFVVRAKEGKGYPQFIYYLMRHPKIREAIIKSMTGTSGRQRAHKEAILNYSMYLPTLNTQKKIGNFLSLFDSKIETNKNIIRNLEKLSQILFKQWFIDFEFPNEEGQPYKTSGGELMQSELGEIPVGFTVSTFGEEISITRGASPRPIHNYLNSEGRPWIKISDASGLLGYYLNSTKECIKEEGIVKSRTVEPGTLILSNSATPGIPIFVNITASVHDGWLIFKDYKKLSKEFYFLYLKNHRDKILSLSNGSVFRNLKTDILKKYKIVLPPESIFNNFQSIIIPIFNEIKEKTTEIKTLENIRDTLLPKLLSGEIKIPDELED